jgi:hypothetical protein
LDISPLLGALGGLLLLVSLFLHWYQPALTAWTVFEVWDVVLAALAIWAIWVAAATLLRGASLRGGALTLAGFGAFVIVVSQLINHPPAAQGASVLAGAWLALIGSALMAGAGALSAGGVSLSVSFSPPPRERERERGAPPEVSSEPPRWSGPSPETEARVAEPEVHEELYPEAERSGPIGADDPELWAGRSEDETLPFEPETEERS